MKEYSFSRSELKKKLNKRTTFNNKKLKPHNFTLYFRFSFVGVGLETHCKTLHTADSISQTLQLQNPKNV